ncbi:MAG: hypothetical protein ACLVJ8_02805 [Ruthenibacterium lactatiformans]
MPAGWTGHICRRLAARTGADGWALARISAFNKTPLLDAESDLPNAAKFLLYQDPLLGLYDLDIEGLGFAQHYASLEAEFAAYAGRAASGLLYRFYELLARVLKNKAELGLGCTALTKAGPRPAGIAGRTGAAGRRGLRSAAHMLAQLWMAECRPQGFEVLELRLAGVQACLEAAAARTEDWCAGSVQRLEELEEAAALLRTPGTSRLHGVYFWREIASASKCF